MIGYPGSKAASGVSERIIRQMPPHLTYIEAFAGCAAVFRKKRPAASSILMDVDAKLCHRLRSYLAGRVDGQVVHGDAMDLLSLLPAVRSPDTLAYFDPPYLREVRTKTVLYDFEFTTPEAHSALLDMLSRLPCMVMVSGYMSPLYAKTLKRWRHSFNATEKEVDGMRFDHAFRQIWRFYLCYCEAGFRTGRTDVMQIELQRKD